MHIVALLVFCAELIYSFINGNIATINQTLWGWDFTNYIFFGFPLISCLTAILYSYWNKKEVRLNNWISLLSAGLLALHLTICIFYSTSVTLMDRSILAILILGLLMMQAFLLRA